MVKMVSFSEAAYAKLKRHKKPGMSFSDVVNVGEWSVEPQKTKDLNDLIAWVESLPAKKRTYGSRHIDETVYGRGRL